MTKQQQVYKTKVLNEIDGFKHFLVQISDAIHQHPEVGLSEHFACSLLTEKARELGFSVETGVAGMETAFIARYEGKQPGPRIAFLAEYDALVEIGHGCGHNLIAASAMGAAAGLRQVVDDLGGTVMIYGTPDEEAFGPVSRGGKTVMVNAGLFNQVDVALMMHPKGGKSGVWRYSFPLKDFTVTFHGKPAHYTVPHEGINALDGLLLFINSVNTLKRGWPSRVMFAYTIPDGGGPSPITVPSRAQAHITMKAFDSLHLDALFSQVEACVGQVAQMTGCKGELEVLGEYRNMIPNLALADSMYRNMGLIGEPVEHPEDARRQLERLTYPGTSTDFGDVSWQVPGIHGYCSVGDDELILHTHEFAAAAGSKPGHDAVMMSSKVMAAVGVEILTDPDFAQRITSEFKGYQKAGFSNVPGIPPACSQFPDNLFTAGT